MRSYRDPGFIYIIALEKLNCQGRLPKTIAIGVKAVAVREIELNSIQKKGGRVFKC